MASTSEDKELKSKKTLTELLEVQIDLNEKLKEENSQFYEQQKKFLALIAKKEKKYDDLRLKMLKNAKPLFLSLMSVFLSAKFTGFRNLCFFSDLKKKGEIILKISKNCQKRVLKKNFGRLKNSVTAIRNYEKNYLFGIKLLQAVLNKIDKRAFFAFSKIITTCMNSKSQSLKQKFKKIAAFKLFFFSEKVDKMIFRKKLHKCYLQIWKNKNGLFLNQFEKKKASILLVFRIFESNNRNKKMKVFNVLNVIAKKFNERNLSFFLKVNSVLNYYKNEHFFKIAGFNKIKQYSGSIMRKNKNMTKFMKINRNYLKRLAFFKIKENCVRFSKLKSFYKILEKTNFKHLLSNFLTLKNFKPRIPDLFPEKFSKNRKIMIKIRKPTQNFEKIKKNIQKHKKILKSLKQKQKIAIHEKSAKSYFNTRKQELETYFSSMVNLMKDTQDNLKQQQQDGIAFQKNKKTIEEANLKILQEKQSIEKQLLEKQELIKKQEKNQEILKKNEEKHKMDIEKLANAIDSLARDKGDLLCKLEESLQNLNELRNEYQEILNQLSLTETEKKKLLESLKLQEKKICLLERKNEEVENNMMNMNKKSPALPPSKETEKGKEKTEKIRKEKKELEEKLKQITEKYEKIKKLNTDLTKEAISLNEEKFEVKNVISTMKESLQSSKNTISNLESKNKNLENDILVLRQENQNLLSNKMRKQDMNNSKCSDENNQLRNENNRLKNDLQKMKSSLEDSWSQINSLEEQNQVFKKRIEESSYKEQQINFEFKSLNDSLATLNKEKVNLMREMTLIHENNLALEKELNKYKDLALQSQNEIENYQNQLDVYSKVLKIMQEKVNNIENKSFEAINKTNKYNECLNDGDLLSKISHLKSKLSYSSPDKGES